MLASGVIGLGPRTKNPGTNNGDSFLRSLFSAGLINTEIFAIKFSKSVKDKSSKITFGGYDSELVGDNHISWEPIMPGNERWKIKLSKMVYGDKNLEIKANENDWILITTGESRLRMYRSVFSGIEDDLRKKFKDCSNADSLFYCVVEDRSLSPFKRLEIHMSVTTIYVDPADYIRFVSLISNCRFKTIKQKS